VVSFAERREYILDRYGKDPERRKEIIRNWEKSKHLEEKLFQWLPFSQDELPGFFDEKEFDIQFARYHQIRGIALLDN